MSLGPAVKPDLARSVDDMQKGGAGNGPRRHAGATAGRPALAAVLATRVVHGLFVGIGARLLIGILSGIVASQAGFTSVILIGIAVVAAVAGVPAISAVAGGPVVVAAVTAAAGVAGVAAVFAVAGSPAVAGRAGTAGRAGVPPLPLLPASPVSPVATIPLPPLPSVPNVLAGPPSMAAVVVSSQRTAAMSSTFWAWAATLMPLASTTNPSAVSRQTGRVTRGCWAASASTSTRSTTSASVPRPVGRDARKADATVGHALALSKSGHSERNWLMLSTWAEAGVATKPSIRAHAIVV
jgi:hypothetical protein